MEKHAKLLISVLIFVVCFALIGTYGYLRSRDLIIGPQVSISEPIDGSVFTDPLVIISGKASNVSHITLNGAPLFTDSAGNFKEQLLLLSGYNILTIEAEDRFGKRVKKTLELIYNETVRGKMASSTLPTNQNNFVI